MSWKKTLNAVLKAHKKQSATGNKIVSFSTQNSRREILEQGFNDLRGMGYKLPDVKGFKERHMTALGNAWEAQKLSPSTIQTRISVFRLFGEWIGKKGMIRDSYFYVKNPLNVTRQLAAKVDKSWSGQSQSLPQKLELLQQKDPHVAIQLELQRAFGLRMKEAALLQPHGADRSSYLMVNWGTKGGRERVVDITTDYQKDVLHRAKELTKADQSMTPKTYSFKQWRSHYYYVCQESGISRKAGITSHGLRHERLNEIYATLTGNASPIKGGTLNKGSIQAVVLDQMARQEVAETAGHSRLSIASAYLGSNTQKSE